MGRHDCVILYNAARISEIEGSKEKIYPSTIIREEVTAIEESLRGSGFNPYVLSVDHFSKDLVTTLLRLAPKFVFNLCEEINGKSELEMCVAGFLELLGIPYTGSAPLALGMALNKYRVKQILRAAGIPVPKGFLYYPNQKPGRKPLRFPVIVKPVREDGSLGINTGSVCADMAQLESQAAYVHAVYRQEALVEEYLEGREFNVSIMGNEPRVLAISEIDFTGMPEGEPKIVSYRAKWDEESPMFGNTVPICPAEISKRMKKRVCDIALRSYQCLGCRDYGRIDMRTDAEGNVYVLEVNPNPDISPDAGFARAAKASGYSYSDMILQITSFALERGTKVASSVYVY